MPRPSNSWQPQFFQSVSLTTLCALGGLPGGSLVKNPLANAEEARDTSLIPRLGRSPGVGNGNPLLYSCLKSPVGREAWWAVVHRVAKLDMTEQLGVLTRMHAHTHTHTHSDLFLTDLFQLA